MSGEAEIVDLRQRVAQLRLRGSILVEESKRLSKRLSDVLRAVRESASRPRTSAASGS